VNEESETSFVNSPRLGRGPLAAGASQWPSGCLTAGNFNPLVAESCFALPISSVYLSPMRAILGGLLLFLLTAAPLHAQTFDFAGKEAVKLPEATAVLIRQYIEQHDGISLYLFKGQYAYVPVFNVLQRAQKQFADGVYYFTWGAHDPGRLFIHRKGKLTFLANGSTTAILADYTTFLKQNPLPEPTQISYLGAIAAFLKFRQTAEKDLIQRGALLEVK
jgi:hypothetical protein